jgi:hypothetical protein
VIDSDAELARARALVDRLMRGKEGRGPRNRRGFNSSWQLKPAPTLMSDISARRIVR